MFKSCNFVVYLKRNINADNPLYKDFFGELICLPYKDLYLGHNHEFTSLSQIKTYIKRNKLLFLPVYIDTLIEECGIVVLSTEIKNKDSRQIGYVFVSYKEMEENSFNKEQALKELEKSINKYNQYYEKNIFYFDLYLNLKYKARLDLDRESKELVDKYKCKAEKNKDFYEEVFAYRSKDYYGYDIYENGMFYDLPEEIQEEIKKKGVTSIYA